MYTVGWEDYDSIFKWVNMLLLYKMFVYHMFYQARGPGKEGKVISVVHVLANVLFIKAQCHKLTK